MFESSDASEKKGLLNVIPIKGLFTLSEKFTLVIVKKNRF